MRPLFAHLSAEKVHTYGLVLTASGIPHRTQCKDGIIWSIAVASMHRQAAIEAIALFLKENPQRDSVKSYTQIHSRKTYSAIYIVTILILIHREIIPGYEHQVFVENFGADAGQIVGGHIHRCVTALLLHANWPHLLSNMAGLALFGTAVSSICGWGMGWLMILMSGTGGNWLTAVWYQKNHLAIGSSTAVFGAVGLCATLNFWSLLKQRRRPWRVWLPLAGGLALVGFLGTAPHSDLMAHLMGFGVGLAIGGLYGWLHHRMLKWPFQLAAAILAAGMVAASWLVGLGS